MSEKTTGKPNRLSISLTGKLADFVREVTDDPDIKQLGPPYK